MPTYNLQLTTNKRRNGESMIEMLVAVSIISVSLMGILALVGRSLAFNRLTTEQYIATYLAAEGIELTKNFFDHSYLATTQANAFYGWTGVDSIAPSGQYGIFFLDSNDNLMGAVPTSCSINLPPTEANVAEFFRSCSSVSLPFLNFDPATGYSYEFPGTLTKFRRAIIIDEPAEGNPPTEGLPTLDYRVTSAVGWESRGGEFVVQLEDHFLPWRIP